MNRDFPFYDNFKIWDLIILSIVPILFTIYTFIPFSFPGISGAFIFTFAQLGAFLIVARGKISLLVKKLTVRDIVRVIVTLILQYVFAFTTAVLLMLLFKIKPTANPIIEAEMGLKFWIVIIVQLFGEELYKILLFLSSLMIMYKLTKKRKLSIIIATLISLTLFGLLHLTTYDNLIQSILLIGVASIICMYNYLKSKNILTSYLQHLLFDAIPFILVMIGIIK